MTCTHFWTSKSTISFCGLCVRLHRTIYILSRHTLCKPISCCPLKDIGLYKTLLLLLIYSRRNGHTLFGTAIDKLLSSHIYVGYSTSFMGLYEMHNGIISRHLVTFSKALVCIVNVQIDMVHDWYNCTVRTMHHRQLNCRNINQAEQLQSQPAQTVAMAQSYLTLSVVHYWFSSLTKLNTVVGHWNFLTMWEINNVHCNLLQMSFQMIEKWIIYNIFICVTTLAERQKQIKFNTKVVSVSFSEEMYRLPSAAWIQRRSA